MPKARLEMGGQEHEETPDQIRERLKREDEAIERARELENQPNVEVVGKKFKKLTVQEKRRRAEEQAKDNAEMDAARKALEGAWEDKNAA
jgi:ABC-type phosphate transport system auxiliary subunit